MLECSRCSYYIIVNRYRRTSYTRLKCGAASVAPHLCQLFHKLVDTLALPSLDIQPLTNKVYSNRCYRFHDLENLTSLL
jgi:hypothetical protein